MPSGGGDDVSMPPGRTLDDDGNQAQRQHEVPTPMSPDDGDEVKPEPGELPHRPIPALERAASLNRRHNTIWLAVDALSIHALHIMSMPYAIRHLKTVGYKILI